MPRPSIALGSYAALFNVIVFAIAAAAGLHLSAAYLRAEALPPLPEGRLMAEQAVRLLLAGAALVGVYELDAHLNPHGRRLMRIATEMGVISSALLFAAGALGFRLVWGAPLAPQAAAAVTWLVQALALGALPGFGVWALLAGATGARAGVLPPWGGAAAGALPILGLAAFLTPQLEPLFAAAAAAWWASVTLALARTPGETPED